MSPAYKFFLSFSMQTRKQTATLHVKRLRDQQPRIKGGGKSRPHSGRLDRSAKLFNAGETVRETGIYEVIHDRAHRIAHEVVMLNGDSFPSCDTCEIGSLPPDPDGALHLSGRGFRRAGLSSPTPMPGQRAIPANRAVPAPVPHSSCLRPLPIFPRSLQSSTIADNRQRPAPDLNA